ncbi:hypothetical protein DXA46_16065 [Bacteroides sp. OF02-3LB]|nr:hypothetical protein DWY71_10755 [Bacteroides sp. AF26-7BH]RGY31681.1 hypothetical protein DXA46_16065 [Bacteroides sp. OF02-3LB]
MITDSYSHFFMCSCPVEIYFLVCFFKSTSLFTFSLRISFCYLLYTRVCNIIMCHFRPVFI